MSDPVVLLSSLAAATGEWVKCNVSFNKTFQAVVSGTGTVTGTVVIDGSNDGVNVAKNIGTITLTATTIDSDNLVTVENWAYFRASLTTVTGTGATVVVTAGF